MVSAACRTRSVTSAALSTSNSSNKADWSRVIAYSVLCVFLVVHTETHAMTRPYLGGTPQEISFYTTPRDANRRCERSPALEPREGSARVDHGR
jgi:hypothetical protein